MPESIVGRERDLTLPPLTYAYVLDTQRGDVTTHVGPTGGTLDPNSRLTEWTGKRFKEDVDLENARKPFASAGQGQYIVLTNPAAKGEEEHPKAGGKYPLVELDVGQRVVIPGPVAFALWPGQSSDPRDGHQLRNNQYVVGRVYDPKAARESQKEAVVEAVEGAEKSWQLDLRNAKIGQLFVVTGEDVSFFMPWTGIEVVPEGGDRESKKFVRDAVTLRQLEYCVLVDQDGSQRIERGPKVVFPKPTEDFVKERGERVFRVLELGPTTGVYVKVTSAYQHDKDAAPLKAWRGNRMVEVKPEEELKEGDELFLTGADTPIYVPRTEHSVVKDGDQIKHYGVAVPEGEARYVLYGPTGEVRRVNGPQTLLPDPRIEQIVRRVLDDKTVRLWYPDNEEARQVNAALRGAQAELTANVAALDVEDPGHAHDVPFMALASTEQAGSLSRSYRSSSGFGGDYVRRRSETPAPKTITLSTKYMGAPRISPYPSYAVLVLDPTGHRRVATSPEDILLQYHETLMPLTLSTGRPKGSSKPIQTVYLKIVNNAVGDKVKVETRDRVPVTLELSLRVNFEGETDEERLKWFDVENYVALLTDHARSRLRNEAKRHGIQEFDERTIDIIRDALLGTAPDAAKDGEPTHRPGLFFPENNMRLYDVEVLDAHIEHEGVGQMLSHTTQRALEQAIKLSEAEADAERDVRMHELQREQIKRDQDTGRRLSEAMVATAKRKVTEEAEERALAEAVLSRERLAADQNRELVQAANEIRLDAMRVETDLAVKRAQAMPEKALDAVVRFADDRMLEALVEELGPIVRATGADMDKVVRDFLGGRLSGLVSGNGSDGHQREPVAG